MSIKHKIGLSSALALALVGCGTNEATDDAGYTYPYPTPDAAVVTPGPDAAVVTPGLDAGTTPVADPYLWVVVQDTEQKACTTNGPGADVDAVAKMDATGNFLGWGLKKSATYKANPLGNACDNEDCNGKNCKYAAISKTFDEATLVSYTEGPYDAVVNDTTSDSGYFSLNAGTLQIEIGDLKGEGTAQAIKSGDYIAVYEVDKTYIASGSASASCVCLPEHFTVYIETASGKTLQLLPSATSYSNLNTACSLAATPNEGCGTTVFAVP
jgi:hypothetical protein